MRPTSLLGVAAVARRPGVLASIAASTLAAFAPAQGTLGVSGSFARLQPARAKTFIKSSSDPDERPFSAVMGNDDGFSGLNGVESFRYQSGFDELSVLADIQGRAGYMGLFFRNFWSGVAGLPILLQERNRAQIYADNQLLHDRLLPDYFRNTTHPRGQIAPFDGPFTAGRAGGYLTHTPIAWQDQFRVQVYENAFENSGRFHKVAGTLMSPERLVDVPDKAAWERVYSRIGGWRHDVPRNATTTRLALPGPDAPAKVRLAGPGAILELRGRLLDPNLWDDIWVRMRWDGMQDYYVEAPLRFFGAMVRRGHSAPMDTLFFGNDGQEIWCYLPMPFDEEAELEFVNRGTSGTSLDLTLATWQGQYPTPWGYFSAHFDQEVTTLGVPFQGPELRDVRGMLRGLFLEDFVDTSGRMLHIDLMHLEGDLCIRINGNRGDDHNFAATETSVGKWGWYGTPSDVFFAGDTSFNTAMLSRVRPDYVIEIERIQGSTYVFDPVQFADGIEICLEHGVQNLANAEYGLFSFFYLQPGAARETFQTLDVGDAAAESGASVQFGTAPRFELTSAFFRDAFFGTAPLHDDGRNVQDYYRFDVQSPRLSRYRGVGVGFRLDRPKVGDGQICQARVFVDGVYAGLMHSYSSNALNRWKEGGELEVELPRSLTDGKSRFTVEVRPVPGTAPLRIGEITAHGYLRD